MSPEVMAAGDHLALAEAFSNQLVHDWLHKQRSSLGRPFFTETIQRHSRLGPCLVSAACSAFPDARTGFLKCQTLAFLAAALQASQVLMQPLHDILIQSDLELYAKMLAACLATNVVGWSQRQDSNMVGFFSLEDLTLYLCFLAIQCSKKP